MKRILVIDDEADIREVIQLTLELTRGWEIVAAESGSEGIALATSRNPDAILLDVMMPEMDGVSTFAGLQAEAATRSIPVVLLTAKVQSADRRRFAELGVAGVIAKPFDPMGLTDQLEALLGWNARREG
ncbi:response regulator [Gloeobacter violaceus]|uniref:Two-component response regulator n=1 Tax=Gloeobacter violaceus (strain ATCC 29082 / PCC 7421) TaxID=251221 RepID=Q7NDM2_GLOVI|nr:response regulator [Gloeobacter violaceus]BAC92154.1 two-component response regulator [Gloeobacter violaceus PCC 7421]